MLSAYFDASGGPEHDFIVVAGYISRIWKWTQLATGWSSVLERYGVPYFHMREFAHSRGPFISWKGEEGKRREFLVDLVRVVADNVERSIACMVGYRNFCEVNEQYQLSRWFPYPYVLAARDCIARANDYYREKNDDRFSVQYIFERGDQGQSALVDRCADLGLPLPVFKPSVDTPTEVGAVQLQCADLASYEIRKAMSDLGEYTSVDEYRQSFVALRKIREFKSGQYTKYDLIRLCEDAGVPRRLKGTS